MKAARVRAFQAVVFALSVFGLPNPSEAGTGLVQVSFNKVGFIVGVGSGRES